LVDLCLIDNARYKNQNCDTSTGKANHQVQVYQAEATKKLPEDGIVLPKHVGAIVNKEVYNFSAFSWLISA
jgi:hypothetical protein